MEILLNDSWSFHKENEASEQVRIPHTYNAVDGQSGTSMWRGKGFYTRQMTLAQSDLKQSLFLEVGASAMVSTVSVNGQKVYENACPYALYRIQVNDYVNEGENQIEIVTDNTANDAVYPQMADFSFYGGLYRDVKLIKAPKLHFDYLDGSRDGVQIRTVKEENGSGWKVVGAGSIVCEKAKSKGKVRMLLLDQGEVVCETSAPMEFSGKDTFSLSLEISKPHLWMGTEDPYLYQVKLELYEEETVVEERSISTGFRTIQITSDQGLFLNGKHVKLRGVARHQDFGGVGNAVSKENMECDMQLMKEIGANSVRLSHYQHDDYFYQRCDEEGILVWAEVPFISIISENEAAEDNIREQMRRLILQCGNHTSVYCWGVQNEITIAGENEEIHAHVKRMSEYTKNLDPDRYTAEANIYSVANESPINRLAELVGYNLYYGWYYDTIPGLQKRLDEFHAACPDIPLLVTEYGVDTNPQYHSYEPKTKDYTEEYQLLFTDNALRSFEERPYFVGSYVWNLCDFGSANRDEGGKQGQNQKGLVTIDRKIKKDAFYLYKAYWSEPPFVKLGGSRFINRHKEENTITVLSNLKKLELLVNDESVAKTENVNPMTTFEGIILSKGKNQITVRGYDGQGDLYEDQMILNCTEEEDKSYQYVKKDEGGNVINWFEKFDLTDAEEIQLDPEGFSSADKVGTIMKNPEGEKVILKYFGTMVEHPKFAMMKAMTLDAMGKLKNLGIPQELITVMNKELNQIKK